MPRHSLSNEPNNDPKQPHPWLLKHYQEKRERTITLVKAAVDQLVKEGQNVTIEAVCRMSTSVDTEGRGVKKSALLENPEAHAYYRQHSLSYKAAQGRKRKGKTSPAVAQPLRIDPYRNVDRVRYRYLQMTKSELVERLLTVEQAYAELGEQQAQLQFAWAEMERQSLQANQKRQTLYQTEQHGGIGREEERS